MHSIRNRFLTWPLTMSLAALATLNLDRSQPADAGSNTPTSMNPVAQQMHGWTVQVDPALLKGEHSATGKRALSMLDNHLERISLIVQDQQLTEMRKLQIWIEHEHATLKGMQYHPSARWLRDNNCDERLAKKVHIPVARHLLSRAQLLKHPAVVLHELSHAYHDQVLGFDDQRIRDAFQNAKGKKSYERVLAHTGRQVRHYALTNEMEYFAEGTEAFLYRNDFYPFVRAEMKESDPGLHDLLEEIWGR